MHATSKLEALARSGPRDGADRRAAGRVMVEGLSCSQGRVIDMNVGGMRVVRGTRWRPGEIRKIAFPVLAGRTMTVAGRCTSTQRAGIFRWVCGVEFLGLSDDQKEALRHIALTNAKRAWTGLTGG